MKKLLSLLILATLTVTVHAQSATELTLENAIAQSLENNLDIQISQLSYQASREDVTGARGIYDLQFNLDTSYSNYEQPSASQITASKSRRFSMTAELSQLVFTGGTVSLALDSGKTSSPGFSYYSFSPEYTSVGQIRFDQPLLRNFGRDETEYQIRLNKKYSERAFEDYRANVMNLISDTESAYLDLVYSFQNLLVAKESLKLAEDQFDITKKKVDVGTLAPVDQLQAEANLADARQKLVSAENLVYAANDLIKRIMNIDRDKWDVQFEPSSLSLEDFRDYEAQECVTAALENSPSIRRAKIDLNVSELALEHNRNQKKPQLSAFALLQYRGNNAVVVTDPITGEPVIDPITGDVQVMPGNYGDAFSDMTGLDNQSYSIGINLSIPIQNRARRTAYMKAKLDKSSSELSLENTITQVTNDVRDALRNLDSSQRSIEAAGKTRELREKNLEIEKKKFVNGMSTNFLVSQREEELAQARISELNARISYRKSLVALRQAMGVLLEDRHIKLENGDN